MSIEITVGICAYNEDRNIAKLLNNILTQQNLPAESEILVVCSGCTDNTVTIVNEFAKKDSRIHTYIENERKGKPSAINHIISNAKGNTIIFISADTLPNKNCFPKLLKKLQQPNVGIVCGNPTPINDSKTLAGKMVHLLWNFHDHIFHELNDAGLARHATEIYCIHKNLTTKIPAETINDDAYIALETKKKGWQIKYERQSRVLICGPKTLKEYFQQRQRIIYGHYQVRRLTGESPQYPMQLLPVHPLKVLALSLWLVKNQSLPTVMTFILTELAANFAAIMDILLKKTHIQWQSIVSTKTITLNTRTENV